MRKRVGLFMVVLAAGFAVVTQGVAPAPSPRASASASASASAQADPTTHTITFDKYSLMIDGQRVFIWSGEFDAFRLPSPSLWRDILEKMKSDGYNAVTIYFDWGYHSPAPGVYDFTGVRDMDQLLDIADQVGIYVIARPGPYINGETDAGGFPDWLEETPGTDRSNNTTYETYTDQWQTAIDTILARHQLTNGTGTVILYQIENEYASNLNTTVGLPYMEHLYNKARADGITVPIFHNDKGRNGDWVPGSTLDPSAAAGDHNYLYGFDGYPGGMCSSNGSPGTPSAPPDWGYYGTGGATGGATASPNTPGFWAEAGTGWFDNWGGVGYSCLNTRMGPSYERTEGATAIANGLKIISPYMTFGGTNWGWLPADVVYTSYDYGAPISEARQLTPKIGTQKEIGYFVQSVAPIDQVDKSTAVGATNISPSGAAVKVYHDVNPTTGTAFYVVRNDSTSNDVMFNLPISTADGSFTIPQSGKIELKGIDAKIITADYNMDSQHLVYSTSEIMTHGTINGQDVALFDNRTGETGETVLQFATQPTVNVLQGSATSTWNAATGDLQLDYTDTGLIEVVVTGGGTNPLLLLFGDDAAAESFWRLDTPAGMVLVRGPELLRTAAVNGSEVDLTGDTTADGTPLEVWAPGATSVTWNGNPVATTTTLAGSLLATNPLAGPPAITLPALANWVYHGEDPESQPSFDDSSWAVANHTTTNSSTTIPTGQKVLFADDYGFHHGDIWYRGTYSGAAAGTALSVSYQAGGVGMVEVWLDGTFLGSNQLPTPAVYSTSPTESATASFTIPAALRTAGVHEISVLVRIMGHSEDGGANNANKAARGLTAVTLTGSTSTQITWKIQGNEGGENITDTVRGPFNNGGLYGERAGWYLAGYPDANWTPVSLPYSDPNPGVAWYRTTFALNEPAGVDASLGLNIADTATKAYRATIFLNGWNMGQYINNVGPQHTFVLPNGVLNPDGSNTLAIAVITNSAGGGSTGGGLGTVSLVNLGTAEGGVPLTMNNSPAYLPPALTAMALPSGSGGATVNGALATVSEPPDALGTSLAATIDWGDGNQSAGVVTGSNGSYTVAGQHTYGTPGNHSVTVSLTDQYGSATLATATTTATSAPVTSATLTPAAVNGYYNQDPTVTLAATDGNGPGVQATYYQVDGGGWQTYMGQFKITGDSTHSLQFYSVDTLGNTESVNAQSVLVDTTPPVTTATISPAPLNCAASPAPGSTCQVNGPATVTLSGTDTFSGYASSHYSIDGAATQSYGGPFTISAGGLHTVTYWSTDVAGNNELPRTLQIQVNPQAATAVTGTVPSTLAVSVASTTPSLGVFTAGSAATYSSTLGATVTTSAQSATLQASDQSSLFTGHLVNSAAAGGPYELAQGLRVDATSSNASASGGGVYTDLSQANPATLLSYSAPASNDAVTIGFQQLIGASDPLRTGSYTKTITITLTTSSP